MKAKIFALSCLAALLPLPTTPRALPDSPYGVFEAAGDVGLTPLKGSAAFDSALGAYRIAGGGANMWGDTDAFHFVWRRLSGDLDLSANVAFEGKGVEAHRKVALMIRQSLDASSAYADVALHGDGLVSLQYRLKAGEETREAQSTIKGPKHIRIERRGNRFILRAGEPGTPLEALPPVTVELQDPVYVGLAVCSHNAEVLETALFTSVSLESRSPRVRSTISIYDLETKSARSLYTADRRFEAPNWSPDGRYLLVNSGGKLYRLRVNGGEPVVVDLGDLGEANNDHGISSDGLRYVMSVEKGEAPSKIFIATSEGNNAREVTPNAPSYYHGWSPNGKWLAYCAERSSNFDIYRIRTGGGEEQRLTTHAGYDDGPDYSPDGKWIYFNSDRSGSWDIWRMPAAGAGPGDRKAERVTSDEFEDWFPHPSPDGQWMVFLSFEKGTEGHPENRNVMLRRMPMPGKKLRPTAGIEVLLRLFGGQGTLNVNSWSPDSRKFAFVSYELR